MSGVSTGQDLLALDREARALACTIFDVPFVLEAGAGTGKTTALVNRIASWCLGPGWNHAERRSRDGQAETIAFRVLEGLVAITFTEAAAAEMASRVAEAFSTIERGELPRGLDGSTLPEPAGRILRARALLSGIDRLVVTTIHAFCRRLLVRFPFESGVAPGFRVDADFSVLRGVVREAMERALERWLGEEDPSLLFLVRRGILPDTIEKALHDLAERGVTEEILARDPLSEEAVRALAQRVSEACRFFSVFSHLAGNTNARKIADASADTVARLAPLGGDLASLERLKKTLEEAFPDKLIDHLRSKLGRGKLTQGEGKSVTESEKSVLTSTARDLSCLLENVRRLDPPLLGHSRGLLGPLLGDVARAMRRLGVSSFSDLLSDTVLLLTRHSEVRNRLRSEIRQLLVDEFQDTDGLQCRIIELLALDGEGERPGLFLVGDPKQSIYGWRSADLRAYDAFVERIRARGGVVHGLSMNFRSPAEMLDEVGRVVAEVMVGERGVQPSYQPLIESPDRTASRPSGESPAVEYWSIVDTTPHGELDPKPKRREKIAAQAVADDVLALAAQGVEWKEIALLVRSASAAESYLDAFRERDVPYHIDRETGFYRRKEIVDATSLLRCALDPNDHLSLVAFLRSPSVGVPDAAWIPLWRKEFPARMSELTGRSRKRLALLHELVDRAVEEVPDVPGLDRIAGWPSALHLAVEALAELRQSAQDDPAPRFVEKLRRTVQIEATEAARHLGRHRVANLQRFFRTLSRVLAEKSGDPMAVMRLLRSRLEDDRRFDEGQPREGIEAVQVLTIHKAKGLDFEHVYLGDAFRGSKGRDTQRVRVGEPGSSKEEEGEYSLFGARTLGFDRLERRLHEVETAERVRLLYVALTRARRRLVVPGLFQRTKNLRTSVETAESLECLLHIAGRMEVLRTRRPRIGEWFNEGAVRFKVLSPKRDSATRMGTRDGHPGLPTEEELKRSARRFRRLVEEAELRKKRPFRRIVTEEAREEWSEERARRGVSLALEDDGETPDPGSHPPAPLRAARGSRALALAVGSAVHRVLERMDPRLPLREAIQKEHEGLIAFVSRELPPEDRAPALERCRDLLTRFAEGPLGRRFTEIAPTLLARELPLLSRPGDGDLDPVGVLSGAIDLLYRDPDTGEPVVVDYKTDSVTDRGEIDDLGRRYLAQGSLYAEAVGDALGLDRTPRFELWLLVPGRILRTAAGHKGT